MALFVLSVLLSQAQPVSPAFNPLVDALPQVPEGLPAELPQPKKRVEARDLRPWRLLTGGGGGALGVALGLAVTYWLTVPNPLLDSTFSNAAAGTLLGTGLAFSAHGILGGKGQPLLAALGAALVMGLSSYVASFIDSPPRTAIWAAAIGCIPLGLVTSLILEFSQGLGERRQ